MMRAAVLLVLCLGLVACGRESNDEKLSGALGGAGKQDAAQLGKYFKTIQPISETDIAIVKAFTAGDVAGARTDVDKLRTIGTDSLAIAHDFNGAKLRTTFVSYSQTIGQVSDAYQAFIDADAGTTDLEYTRMGKHLRARKQHLRTLDNKLLLVIKDVMPKDQYAKVQRHIKELQQRYNKAQGG